MSYELDTYKPRKINYNKLLEIKGWNIKTYTITNKESFTAKNVLQKVIENIPAWICGVENYELPTYKTAFLIVHEAREGVWILFNWWTGGEMIDSKVYFCGFDESSKVVPSPYNSDALVCIWELEVFGHERAAWIEHILQNAKEPRFDKYLKSVLNG